MSTENNKGCPVIHFEIGCADTEKTNHFLHVPLWMERTALANGFIPPYQFGQRDTGTHHQPGARAIALRYILYRGG